MAALPTKPWTQARVQAAPAVASTAARRQCQPAAQQQEQASLQAVLIGNRGAHHPVASRRAALALLPALTLLGTPALATPALAAEQADEEDGEDFYSRWPYVQPSDILPYLRATAKPGDPDSVLAAIDTFASYYPFYRSGPEKGAVLQDLVAREAPALAIELGTFMAYGTILIAQALPPGARVVTIEADPQQAEVARQVLALAGLGDPSRVQVLTGLSSQVLPCLAASLPPADRGRQAGFVFLDHCKPCYLPDLQAMEALGLVGEGSLVVADNVLYPGTPEYLAHVQAPGSSADAAVPAGLHSRSGPLGLLEGTGGGGGGKAAAVLAPSVQFLYRTQLIGAAFEVEQRYKEGWEPQRDALAVSKCLGKAAAEE